MAEDGCNQCQPKAFRRRDPTARLLVHISSHGLAGSLVQVQLVLAEHWPLLLLDYRCT